MKRPQSKEVQPKKQRPFLLYWVAVIAFVSATYIMVGVVVRAMMFVADKLGWSHDKLIYACVLLALTAFAAYLIYLNDGEK